MSTWLKNIDVTKDDIKIDLREIVFGRVDWIHLAQDKKKNSVELVEWKFGEC